MCLRWRSRASNTAIRDAMRLVTKQAVREARLKVIKQELLNSEKLKDNDKDLHPAVIKPHLKNILKYLIPPTLRGRPTQCQAGGGERSPNLTGSSRQPSREQQTKDFRSKNPLKSFCYTGVRSRGGKACKS
uniref:Uncharacterized protein n=1 Tax=Hucho hucho TaxID=62062 RepID=A0A4W5MI33_9TELE